MRTWNSRLLLLSLVLLPLTGISNAGCSETVLHSFGGSDGSGPMAGLIQDKAGNLYGTTYLGGSHDLGTVFKIAPDGTESVIYSFRGVGSNDGANPQAGLTPDADGNLYGTTLTDGKGGNTSGTVFKISPDGKEKILHSFTGFGDGVDGAEPMAGVILDGAGNLYGTTSEGGGANCPGGCGTVFRISADGHEKVLHAFDSFDRKDGGNPQAPLLLGSDGNFYGTTAAGGSNNDGTVFKLTPKGKETVLHNFTGFNSASDGGVPVAPLIADAEGIMYGTTWLGGTSGEGTVFKIAPDGTETVLYNFTNGHDGFRRFFGTTELGGAHGRGVVFQVNR